MILRHWLPILALVSGCGYPPSGAAPGPLSPTVVATAGSRWADATPESLEKGRQLFLAKCNGCHAYPDVSKIDEKRWPSILERMGKNAGLSAPDTELVLRFILAERSAAPLPG